MNNGIVSIKLDRVRFLRFGHKAMKRWSAYTGQDVTQINTEKFTPEDMEVLLYFMLEADAKAHNEELKIEDMEELLDLAPLGDVYKALGDTMTAAFPEAKVGDKAKN